MSPSSRSPSPTPVNTLSSQRFLSERDLKENIVKENPVQRNIDPVETLDHSRAKVVESRQETLTEMDLETVQSKIRDVLGPIFRLWTIIEIAVTQENSEENENQVSLEDILRLIKKSYMQLSQANNKVSYFRRLNILNVSLNSKSDAKGVLNTYAPLLSTNSAALFGCQFWKEVLDNTKSQKETLEMFRGAGKTKKKPFSAEFSARNNESTRGSARNSNRISLHQHFRTQQQHRWHGNTTSQTSNKSNCKTSETSGNYLLQHFSKTSSTRKINTSSSFSKGNVPGVIKTKCPSRRNNFSLFPILESSQRIRQF